MLIILRFMPLEISEKVNTIFQKFDNEFRTKETYDVGSSNSNRVNQYESKQVSKDEKEIFLSIHFIFSGMGSNLEDLKDYIEKSIADDNQAKDLFNLIIVKILTTANVRNNQLLIEDDVKELNLKLTEEELKNINTIANRIHTELSAAYHIISSAKLVGENYNNTAEISINDIIGFKIALLLNTLKKNGYSDDHLTKVKQQIPDFSIANRITMGQKLEEISLYQKSTIESALQLFDNSNESIGDILILIDHLTNNQEQIQIINEFTLFIILQIIEQYKLNDKNNLSNILPNYYSDETQWASISRKIQSLKIEIIHKLEEFDCELSNNKLQSAIVHWSLYLYDKKLAENNNPEYNSQFIEEVSRIQLSLIQFINLKKIHNYNKEGFKKFCEQIKNDCHDEQSKSLFQEIQNIDELKITEFINNKFTDEELTQINKLFETFATQEKLCLIDPFSELPDFNHITIDSIYSKANTLELTNLMSMLLPAVEQNLIAKSLYTEVNKKNPDIQFIIKALTHITDTKLSADIILQIQKKPEAFETFKYRIMRSNNLNLCYEVIDKTIINNEYLNNYFLDLFFSELLQGIENESIKTYIHIQRYKIHLKRAAAKPSLFHAKSSQAKLKVVNSVIDGIKNNANSPVNTQNIIQKLKEGNVHLHSTLNCNRIFSKIFKTLHLHTYRTTGNKLIKDLHKLTPKR